VTGSLPGPPDVSPASLALAQTAHGVRIFAAGRGGTLTVTSATATGWRTRALPGLAAPGSALAAVTTPTGQARALFRDRAGRLAEFTESTDGNWLHARLPGIPAAGTALAATNYLLQPGTTAPPSRTGAPSSGTTAPLGEEIFYLTATGGPAVTFAAGQGWQTATLPGTATGLVGANAYQVTGQPSQVFLSGTGAAVTEETSDAPTGPWSATNLPTVAATFADRVVLYAATQADDATALAAASAAGLPARQVTTSFATAWAHTLSGDYLVISVGLAATDALYYNVCGWDNPSGDIPGSTPFYTVSGPLDRLPGAGAYENAAATASQATARAVGLAYYAVHGTLPPGVTSLPAAARPQYACSGSPS